MLITIPLAIDKKTQQKTTQNIYKERAKWKLTQERFLNRGTAYIS